MTRVALAALLGSLLCASPRAHAGDLGSLRMPLTPSVDHRDSYHGLIKRKRASEVQWSSLTPGFTCRGDGDFVRVEVERATWPGKVPDKVWCQSAAGKKVKARVQLYDEWLTPMFVGDGTLVLPREPGRTAAYKGMPPRMDVSVQTGVTEGLTTHCEVEFGPVLVVEATLRTEDGHGACTIRTLRGERVSFPITVRTIERSGR